MLSYAKRQCRCNGRSPGFMNEFAKQVAKHPGRSFLFSVFALLITLGFIRFTHWGVGLGAIVVFYTLLSFVIFCHARPREWEASILFVAFIGFAIAIIWLFGGLYQRHDMLAIRPFTATLHGHEPTPWTDGIWDYFYYSTVVFTTLGFGDITPKMFSAKVTTSLETLLGMAYGVTAVFIFLGRLAWRSTKGEDDEPKPESSNANQSAPQTDIEALLRLSTAQSEQLAELRSLQSSHASETKQRLERLTTAAWVLTCLVAILAVTCVFLTAHLLRVG